MNKNLIRILIAMGLSITGVLLSVFFLKPDLGGQQGKQQSPLAKVTFSVNDVKKQGVDKLIWEPVQKGDLLYLGEKLKTSTASSAKIEFLENNAIIDIESDSLIVVNKNNQKLSLQVVEGSLFVSSNENNSDFNVTSGNSTDSINIKNGDVSYSVNKDGKANVEVIKGNIDSKNSNLANKFKDLYPGFATSFFIDSKSDEGIFFKWKPLGEEYAVKLEIGNERNNLIEKTEAQIDEANGVAKTSAIIGTIYWKLTAQSKTNPDDKFSSSVFKVTYNQKVPPIPVYPLQNDLVQLKTSSSPIDFKWNTLNSFESITLEIYSDENKSVPIVTEQIQNQTYFSTNKIQRPGKYYWKLSGKIAGSEGSLQSTQQNFQVIIGDELQSPVQMSPDDRSTIYATTKNDNSVKNIALSWKSNKEAVEYLVTIKKDGASKEFKVQQNEFIIPSLGTGQYTWNVQSINDKNEVSKKINTRSFSIAPMEQLSFKDLKDKVYYYNQMPTYKFNWNTLSKAEAYQLKISQSPSFTSGEVLKVRENLFNYQIGKEGFYYAEVSGLDQNDNVMAKSEVFTFQVTKAPAPKAPIILEAEKKIEATPNGDISFNLVNYQENFQSVFEIKDQRGNLIDSTSSKSAVGKFTSLNPGTFYLTVKYVDELGQNSETSPRLVFVVPDKSAIAPPSTKGVRIR